MALDQELVEGWLDLLIEAAWLGERSDSVVGVKICAPKLGI